MVFINSKGFSLIELVVVLTILAILATIGLIQFIDINSRARDSARRADVYELATALEVNWKDHGYSSLQAAQFSSFQWKDPSGNAYCIASTPLTSPLTSEPWGSNCPEGFVPVAPGVPSEPFTVWKICGFLEKPDPGSAHVFCRSSRQ